MQIQGPVGGVPMQIQCHRENGDLDHDQGDNDVTPEAQAQYAV